MYAHNLQHGIAIENTVRGVLGTPELLSECRLWPIIRYGAAVAGGITWNLVHQVRDYERAAGSMQPAFSLWLCLGQAHACSGST